MAELEEYRAQAKIEEQNKEIIKRFYEELNKGNAGNAKVYNQLFAPDFRLYTPSNSPKLMSLEEAIDSLKPIYEVFPDIAWSIEDLIAVGEKVITRTINTGTHEGDLQGIPAIRKKFRVGEIIIFRLQDGKVVEQWVESDSLGMMMQLGMELKPKKTEK